MSFSQERNYHDYGSTVSGFTNERPRSESDQSLYNQYCDNISSNLFSINNHVSALEKACQDIGTQDDSENLREKIHRIKQNTNESINTTTRFIKELNRLAQMSGREQRLQADRLEADFKKTVQRYDSMQKQLVPKMRQAMLPPKSRSTNVWGVDEDEEKQSLLDAEKLQQQQQISSELEFEQGLLLEREAQIRQIEADILDVNIIFRDLATMVHEQGSAIGTIEENITATAYQVETAVDQLSKASSYQSKYRKKVCWLVLILLIIAAIITIVIVLSQRN